MFEMKSTLIFIILTFVGISNGHSFCDHFIKNNQSVYQYDHQIEDHFLHLLFSGDKYWSIDVYIDPKLIDIRLELKDSWDRSDWLANDYETGFSYWSTGNTTLTGLVTRNSSGAFVSWAYFGKIINTQNILTKIADLRSNGRIVSTSERESVTFLTTDSVKRKLTKYSVNESDYSLMKSHYYTEEETAISGINVSYEVIARFRDGNPDCDRHTVCYLFRINTILKYCIVTNGGSANAIQRVYLCSHIQSIPLNVIIISSAKRII